MHLATKINIPNSVEKIGFRAFADCTSLPKITIPDSVEEIGNEAFAGCSALKEIKNCPIKYNHKYLNISKDCKISYRTTCSDDSDNSDNSDNNDTLIIKPGETIISDFEYSKHTHIKYVVIFPNSVTKIGGWAFACCSSLTNITSLDGVKEIGSGAFLRCSSLTNITIPDSVKEIDWSAFSDCSSLEKITISKKVREIGDDAFGGCVGLKEITISYRFEDELSRIFSGVDLSKVKINWI